MNTLSRFQFNSILRAAGHLTLAASQVVTPSASNAAAVTIDASLGSQVALMPFVDDTQSHTVPVNMVDGSTIVIALAGGGGSGSWKTWQAASPATPGFVFIMGAAPTAGATALETQSFCVQRVGVQYFVYPGASPSEDLSRYDIVFGDGLDKTTRRFSPNFSLNPAGIRVIFYTPAGSDTGPTAMTLKGVACQVYTRKLLAGCRALVRTCAVDVTGAVTSGTPASDWTLFPAGTLNVPADTNGESSYGECANMSGLSMQYPTVFGTYDATDMYNPVKWNKGLCLFDFSACKYGYTSTGFFYSQGHNEQNLAFVGLGCRQPNPVGALAMFYTFGTHRNYLYEGTVTDGATTSLSGAFLNISAYGNAIASITSSGTTATAALTTSVADAKLISYIQTANAAGQQVIAEIYGCTGATAANYNTTLNAPGVPVTYVDATHFSFPIPDAGGVAAAGAPKFSFRTDAQAPAVSSTNFVFNQCGMGYMGYANGAHALNIIAGGTNNLRFYDILNVHGGWSRNGSRSAVPWTTPAPAKVVTSLTQSAGVVTALMPDTSGIVAPSWAYFGSATNWGGQMYVTAVNPNVSITCTVDLNVSTYGGSAAVTGWLSGNTLNLSSVTAPGVVKAGQLLYGPTAGIAQATLTAGVTMVASISGTTMAVTAISGGGIPTALVGSTLAAGTVVVSQSTSTEPGGTLGLRGNYQVNLAQTMSLAAVYSVAWTFDGVAQNVGSSGSPVSLSTCCTWADPQASGFNCDMGDPPDVFSHGFYLNGDCHDIRMYDIVNAWDDVDQKLTGGPYVIQNWTDIRCPMSFIFGPMGNDSAGMSWAQGSSISVLNHLQVFSEDCTPTLPRGYAPQFPAANLGSKITNSLILNNSNSLAGSNSVPTRTGFASLGFQYSGLNLSLGFSVSHAVMAAWGPNSVAQEAGGSKSYAYCVTDDPAVLPALIPATGAGAISPNVSNQLVSAAQSSFQAALTATKALSIAGSFRLATPELAAITPVGDGSGTDLATELKVLDYMLYNPSIRWGRKLHTHFRQYLGR